MIKPYTSYNIPQAKIDELSTILVLEVVAPNRGVPLYVCFKSMLSTPHFATYDKRKLPRNHEPINPESPIEVSEVQYHRFLRLLELGESVADGSPRSDLFGRL